MLVVDLRIVSRGASEGIGSVRITNDGKHPKRPERGSYVVQLAVVGNRYTAYVPDHLRSEGAWSLVMKALEALRAQERSEHGADPELLH